MHKGPDTPPSITSGEQSISTDSPKSTQWDEVDSGIELGPPTLVEHAKESLGTFAKLKVAIKERFTNRSIAKTEKKAERDIAKHERISERLDRRLDAKKRKLERKTRRINDHANSAPHESVKQMRLQKLASLNGLRDEISQHEADKAARQQAIATTEESRAQTVADKRSNLNEYAQSKLDEHKDKLAAKEMKRDMKSLGYNRAERKVAMEALSDKNKRDLGDAALRGISLDRQEQKHRADHARTEAELKKVTNLSDKLHDELEQTESNHESILKQIDEANKRQVELEQQLTSLDNNSETFFTDRALAYQELGDHNSRLSELHRKLELAKNRIDELNAEMDDVAEKLQTAEEGFFGSKSRFKRQQDAINKARDDLSKEVKQIKQKIYNNQ